MDTTHPADRRGISGELVFVWLALLATTVVFTPFAAMTFWGIVSASPPTPAPGEPGAISAVSGSGYVIMDILGVTLLGVGLAYGAYKYHTRDRRKDPVTEQATEALYDAAGAKKGRDTLPEDRPLHDQDGSHVPRYS